jgi:hypothetical protein
MATYLPNVTDVIPEPALFTPNFPFIDTMLRRRQGLYEQGFAQVNSAYNFVNRNVTNPYSSKVRDEFLRQANQNLKNLSSLDLSQQQNVKMAAGVFEPFVKNRAVLGDMAVTAHWDQQLSIAESYRLKDGGKEYSDDNVAIIRQQMEAFANDDISTVGQYYANRESYTPYYDSNKEVMEAMKNFKPSSYKVTRIDGLYKITKDDKSWREAEVAEYLSGVLSDRAKKQYSIEAQVKLGNNPQALAAAYKQVAEEKLEMNKYNIDLIDKQLLTTKDAAAITQLKTRKESIEDSNREIDTNLQNLSKGDLSYIKKNSKSLANAIYFNSKLSGFVKSYAHDDISIDIDGDQVGLALMREDRADARQQRAFRNAREMKELELGLAGNYQLNQLNLDTEGDELDFSIANMQKSIDEKQQQINDISRANKQHILTKVKERNPDSKLTIDQIDDAFISNWVKTAGVGGTELRKDDVFYKNLAAAREIKGSMESDVQTLNSIDNASTQGMSADEKRKINNLNREINNIGTITLDDGSKITGKELATGIKNGTISATTLGNMGAIKINGKTHFVANTPIVFGGAMIPVMKNSQLISAYNKIENLQSSIGNTYDKYMSNRQTYVEQNYPSLTLGNTILTLDEGSKSAKSLEATVGSYLPSGFEVKHVGIGTDAVNQGNSYYYITPKGDNEVSSEDIVNQLTARGAKVKVIKTKKGAPIYEVEGLNNSVANQYRQYTQSEISILNSLSQHQGFNDYQSIPFTTAYGNTQFIIKKSNNLYYLHINGLGESYPSAFNNPTQAIAAARLLSANSNDIRLFQNAASGSADQIPNEGGVDYNYEY